MVVALGKSDPYVAGRFTWLRPLASGWTLCGWAALQACGIEVDEGMIGGDKVEL